MPPDRTRWTDDRLDDRFGAIDKLMSALDTQVDGNTKLVDSHDRDLKQISRRGDRRAETSRTLQIGIWLVLATQIAQIISHHVH